MIETAVVIEEEDEKPMLLIDHDSAVDVEMKPDLPPEENSLPAT